MGRAYQSRNAYAMQALMELRQEARETPCPCCQALEPRKVLDRDLVIHQCGVLDCQAIFSFASGECVFVGKPEQQHMERMDRNGTF